MHTKLWRRGENCIYLSRTASERRSGVWRAAVSFAPRIRVRGEIDVIRLKSIRGKDKKAHLFKESDDESIATTGVVSAKPKTERKADRR